MEVVLVTGAGGFIGSHLCESLLEQGFSVLGVDNFDPFYGRETKEQNLKKLKTLSNFSFVEMDLCNVSGLYSLSEDIQVVIHLAAKAGVLPSIKDPQGYFNSNLIASLNLLEFMKVRGIKKYIFASSSSVYGNNKSIPFLETDRVDNPISPYAFTKKAGELLNYTYHSLYKLDVVNLRFFTVYGPRQRPDLAIHKFFNLIYKNQPVPLYGDGSTARDYTFVHDTVQGIVSALRYILNNNEVYEIFNLGNSSPIKLLDLISTIYKVIGVEPNIQFLPMQPGDVDITYSNIDKAIKVLGYSPKTTLEDGLIEFNNWLLSEKVF